MTSATSPTSAANRAVQDTAERLRAQGWHVTIEPSETDLPAPLHGFRPDLLARRGQEHLVVQVASRQRSASMRSVALAEQVNRLPGWRLDMVYAPEPPLIEDQEQLLNRAARARDLATSDPEAALLLGWSAMEGTLHRLADSRGGDVDSAGALLARLASLGAIDEDEHELLRDALHTRNALVHGQKGPAPDVGQLDRLMELIQTMTKRTTAAA